MSQRSTVTGWTSGVGDAGDAVTAALRTGRGASLSTVVGPLTDIALADVHVWLRTAGQDLMRISPGEPAGKPPGGPASAQR